MVGQFQDKRPTLCTIQFLFHDAGLYKVNTPDRVSFVENIFSLMELVLVLECLYSRQVLPFAMFHQEAVSNVAGKAVGIEIDHGGEFWMSVMVYYQKIRIR
jgi:hypothetical protein